MSGLTKVPCGLLICCLYKSALCSQIICNMGLQVRRPDLIDPALLRPGRLDVLLYVGVAEDSHSKLKVLQALTRMFVMEHDIDLGVIAEKCPPAFTGADMYALSSDAWMTALKRTVAQVWPCPMLHRVHDLQLKAILC